MPETKDKLPDLVVPNLRLVFVGTAVSHRSATEEFQNRNARDGFLRRGRFQFR